MTHTRWFIISFSVSAMAGLIAAFLIKSQSGTEAFLVGLVVFLGVELVWMIFEIERSSHVSSDVSSEVKSLRDLTEHASDVSSGVSSKVGSLVDLMKPDPNNPVSELAISFGLGIIKSKDSVCVAQDKCAAFWRQCMLRSNISWTAISYTIPEEDWGEPRNTAATALQIERLSNGCSIERVFLVDSETELDTIRREVEHEKKIAALHHLEDKINIKYLFKKNLPKNVDDQFIELGTYDFAVADKSWVFISKLDSKRQVVSAKATREQDIPDSAEILFRKISHQAIKF